MTFFRRRRPEFWMLVAIVFVGAVIRFRGLAFGLPYTQARPDETFIIDAARALLAGTSPEFFDYPWFYIGLVALGDALYFVWGAISGRFQTFADMLASWPAQFIPFFIVPRVISALTGTLTLVLVYRLGRQLRDETTGLVAALFLAVAFIHARDSHFGTTDVTMTLFIVAAVSVLLDADRTQQPRHYALAGLFGGLASATKYNAVILLLPMAIVYGLRLCDPRLSTRQALLDRRWLYLALPFLIGFAVGVPFVWFDWSDFLVAMRILASSMATGDARLGLQAGWLHHLQFSLRYGLGLPLLLLSLAGMALVLRVRPRAGLITLAFPIAYYLVAGSFRNLFFRYMIPAVPFLCVTAAFLVSWLSAAIAARTATADAERRASTVAAAMTLLLAMPSVLGVVELDRVLSARDNRQVVADYFDEHVPAGSSLLQSGSRLGHARFALDKRYREQRWDGRRRAFMLDDQRTSEQPDWILVQDSPLPSATQDIVKQYLRNGYVQAAEFKATALDPDIVYDRQDAFFVPFNGLERIERPGPNFTLYRHVEPAAVLADAEPHHSRP